MVDTKEENRRIEASRIERFLDDPDFDRRYPLSAIMSLVLTPPPNPLSELKIPTMFLIPIRGFYPSYEKDSADFHLLRKSWLKSTVVFFLDVFTS